MVKPSKPYQDYLVETLKDPAQAVAYLNAALAKDEEATEAENNALFLLALRNVAEAWGFSNLAAQIELDPAGIYHMLSETGNPCISSVKALLDAMGLRLAVVAKDSQAA
jgi:DNA-binding phage protein